MSSLPLGSSPAAVSYTHLKAGLPIKDGIIRNEELVQELKRLANKNDVTASGQNVH